MKTAGALGDRSKKELADMAKRKGVRGWERMAKDDLVKALGRLTAKPAPKPAPRPAAKPVAKSAAKVTKPAKPAATRAPKPAATRAPKPAVNGTHRPAARVALPPPKPAPVAARPVVPAAKPTPPAAALKPPVKPLIKTNAPPPAAIPPAKDLSAAAVGATKDRILLMVPDPFWLHAYWELTHQSVQRAEAALKQDWYGARPIIRVFDVTSTDTTSTSETPVRDVQVHGECNNWYIDIPQPPRSYRADIGYVSRRGEFFVLARSNVVTPPKAGSTEALDVGMGELDPKKAERLIAMSTGFDNGGGSAELKELFEERLRRPLGAPKDTGFGTGAALPASLKKFQFEIDAELIVYGKTDPAAHCTLQNEPVKLRPDGTFTMRFSLPDSRQIIPAVATSADGGEERTIVLAVERNTKHLDPMIHDPMGEQ
ncbi:DUF4912 domain-containing protein [Urbifossiella limnaea]|uniref:DUF4912 domain-containing protein n=1 Tax=Urbifossiella limnaea TaxID=2528023 RepID=A0A517Y2I0_9BACT|nr:DUF4912 domain-containing protein [Urbifossiella limnaea]QDU23996.1 hypothetical protein ETAA1_60070 [Urbifossiella limnaea]